MSSQPRRFPSRASKGLLVLGVAAFAIAIIAVYAAAVTFFVGSRPGNDQGATGDTAAESLAVQSGPPPAPPAFAASDYRQSRFPPQRGRPLIGVNYTHYAFPNCTFHRTYIPAWYHAPGVAERVHHQLMEMRQDGIQAIRTVLWHDEHGQDWGPIPSPDGELSEPYRTNLIRFVTEVKRFGFARFTLAFEPERTHNPLRRSWHPSQLTYNWRFIRTVRALVKRHGPPDTRFDLFSEGAPNERPTRYEPRPRQTSGYIRELYRRYVRRFGNRDVTVSAIGSGKPLEETNRLEFLVRTLRSSGVPLPRWWDIHIGYVPAQAEIALRHALAALDRQRQFQPVVIADLGYDNPGIARAIKRAMRGSPRRLDEVSPWYTRTHLGCQVIPPYAPGAYRTELQRR